MIIKSREQLTDGRFGMARETGQYMNAAVASAHANGIGMGEGLGQFIADGDKDRVRILSWDGGRTNADDICGIRKCCGVALDSAGHVFASSEVEDTR